MPTTRAGTRSLSLLAVFTLTTALLLATPTPAMAGSWNGDFRSTLNNRCVEVVSGTLAVAMADCVGESRQKWRYDGAVIRHLVTDQCLDVRDQRVGVRACDGGDGQRWTQEGPREGPALRNGLTQQCLEIDGAGWGRGVALSAGVCGNAPHQLWWDPVWLFDFSSAWHGKCWQVLGASSRDGDPLGVSTCSGDTNQKWHTVGEAIQYLRASLCLDVLGADTQNGAEIVVSGCTGAVSQRWYRDGERIRSRLNGRCAGLTRDAEGARVRLWDCTDGVEQKWRAPWSG
ncbi:RICIN domain-containing protein [Crossiella sp. NPDC003009]